MGTGTNGSFLHVSFSQQYAVQYNPTAQLIVQELAQKQAT